MVVLSYRVAVVRRSAVLVALPGAAELIYLLAVT
jgi:hypothetical protein